MKRFISLLIMLVLVLLFSTALFIPSAASENKLAPGEGAEALDGKKVLFTGCSYTYYGGIVEQTGVSHTSQTTRGTDTGFFWRLCRQHGIDVDVTDWVFGGHDLTDIFDGNCNAGNHTVGHDHLADLVDRDYDYVVLQEILVPDFDYDEEYTANIEKIQGIFREANPDTKFYFLVHQQVYSQASYDNEWKKFVQGVSDLGVTVIDWGALVYDVYNGYTEVPGATEEYTRQSFVISKSKDDGYHPNLLAGYLGTIMLYASITGETTVGQPYEFIYPLTSKYLNIDKFIANHYVYDDPDTELDESLTNMKDIFYSEADMLGLQTLADEYLEKTRWLDFATFDVSFVDEGETISEATYKWGETVTEPTAPTKAADKSYTYEFAGWDTALTPCDGDVVYTAVYEKTPILYTVTFLDDDGSTLHTDEYEYGAAITPPTVSQKTVGDYTYTFSGWSSDVSPTCTGEATYTAEYIKVENGILITFRDYDNTIISINTYSMGDTVIVPAAPTRDSDEMYDYTFVGWSSDVSPTCTGEAEYIAVYEKTPIVYTVTFVVEGEVVKEISCYYGATITPPTATPTKESDSKYTYTFEGWDTLVADTCAGDATYTAEFSSRLRIYSIVFLDHTGEHIATRNANYGVVVNAPKPQQTFTEDGYTYTFVGWDKEIVACEGDATYTTVYEKTPVVNEDNSGKHVCEGVNGWHVFWNAICNFFRRIFLMPELCPCGKTQLIRFK